MGLRQDTLQLDQARDTSRRFDVTYVCLEATNAAASSANMEDGAGLNRISESCASAVCLDGVILIRRAHSLLQDLAQKHLLRQTIGRGEARAPTILHDPARTKAETGAVILVNRERTAAFTTRVAISCGIKRAAASGWGGHPRLCEHFCSARREH